jgi:hypothetical protein
MCACACALKPARVVCCGNRHERGEKTVRNIYLIREYLEYLIAPNPLAPSRRHVVPFAMCICVPPFSPHVHDIQPARRPIYSCSPSPVDPLCQASRLHSLSRPLTPLYPKTSPSGCGCAPGPLTPYVRYISQRIQSQQWTDNLGTESCAQVTALLAGVGRARDRERDDECVYMRMHQSTCVHATYR